MLKRLNAYNQQQVVMGMGDKVYLDTSDISTTQPSQKLSHHQLGPYVIEKQVS